MKPIQGLSALALLFASTALVAQERELDEVIFYGYQTEIEADRIGVSVEVIDQGQSRAQPLRYADRFEQEPGITVAGNGGAGGVTYIRIRGLDQKYIPVLIDGIDVTDPAATQHTFDWGSLSGSTLGRVEILKGSSSARFGADAVGGVVNIQSPRPESDGTTAEVGVEVGSYNTRRASARVMTQGDRGWLSFSLARNQSDGFSASSSGTEADGFASTQINLAGEAEVSDTIRVGGALYALNAENEFDEFQTVAPFALIDGTPDEKATTKARGARVYVEADTGAVTHTLSFSGYQSDRTSASNGTTRVFDGSRRKIDYKGVWDASEALTVSFGADVERESLTTGGSTFTVETRGVWTEALFAPNDRTDLAFSLRADDHQTFGRNISGRIAASFRPMDDLILRAAIATGFRAPSLYELYGPFGNASLAPEKSLSAELGVEKQFASGFIKATVFQNRVEDLIDFSFATFRYAQTSGQTKIRGLELSGETALNDMFTLFGSYTLTKTETATGGRLLRVPRHDLVLGVNADMGNGWSGNMTINHIADRPAEFGTVMGDYTTVGLGVTKEIGTNAEAYLRVENLLDEKYETAAGYASSGRAVFVGLRARF